MVSKRLKDDPSERVSEVLAMVVSRWRLHEFCELRPSAAPSCAMATIQVSFDIG